jgi:hypothetical protein
MYKTKEAGNPMVDQTFVNVFHFETADVEANHKGYLTEHQISRLRRGFLLRAALTVVGVLICVALGIALLSAASSPVMTIAGLVAFVAAVAIGIISVPRLLNLMRDLNEGRVSVVRGKASVIPAANILSSPKLKVQEIVLTIPAKASKEFSDHTRYNIYYVPHSQTIVAAEVAHK